MERCRSQKQLAAASAKSSAWLPMPLGSAIAGFTLLELAVTLVIIALLLGMLLLPLSAQQDMLRRTETQTQLDTLRDALMGYAIENGQLPCPAIAADNGLEDRGTGTPKVCNKLFGFVPWATLGVASGQDGWGRLIYYSVSADTANKAITLSSCDHDLPCTAAEKNRCSITLLTRDATGSLTQLSNKDDVPAVLYSAGKNGCGATQADSAGISQLASCPGHVDELTNLGQNALSKGNSTWNSCGPYSAPGRIFIYRQNEAAAAAGGEFDDMLSWISPFVLFNQMVSAGRLPRTP